jgi:cyclophilin family peptidyl-prolyl cis-trans isomerase
VRRAVLIAATALVVGCPSHTPGVQTPQPEPAAADDRALRLQVANAEARRAGGVAELVELVHRGDAHAVQLAERGLARIGDTSQVHSPDALALAATLDDDVPAIGPGDPPLRQALVLGRRGRKKLALTPAERAQLAAWTNDAGADLRYAATWALAREFEPPADDVAIAALAARLDDEAAETRAVAIDGLGKHHALEGPGSGGFRGKLGAALRDPDWRVRIAAVRALADDEAGRGAIAAALDDAADERVVIEALHLVQKHGGEPAIAAWLGELHAGADPLARGWIECLATAALQRAAAHPDYAAVEQCGHGQLDDAHRLPLVADLVAAGVGDLAARRAALRVLAEHPDARVRAAALPALSALWYDNDELDRQALVAQLASAIASPDLIVAASAVDAAPAMYEALANAPARAALDAAVAARAEREHDVELSSDLYTLIGAQHITAGARACRAGIAAPERVRSHAAFECATRFGDPGAAKPAVQPAAPPPVDVAAVIGHDLRLHLQTLRGEIVIALRPDVAPWACAAVVSLARKGFYDRTEFHRVVPGFVVQGGDPTGTGAGGPGFTLPSEPALASDGAGFITGAVGIADAGRDSGGSQFFIMHARAPHLDGRYTWFGQVVSGQDVADALVVGDQIVHASVEDR